MVSSIIFICCFALPLAPQYASCSLLADSLAAQRPASGPCTIHKAVVRIHRCWECHKLGVYPSGKQNLGRYTCTVLSKSTVGREALSLQLSYFLPISTFFSLDVSMYTLSSFCLISRGIAWGFVWSCLLPFLQSRTSLLRKLANLLIPNCIWVNSVFIVTDNIVRSRQSWRRSTAFAIVIGNKEYNKNFSNSNNPTQLMGNSLAKIISNQLYPVIKDKFFPVIDNNLESKEAKKIKKHLTQLFKDIFQYEIKPGSAIGSYADKINLLSFMISLRVKFQMWIDKGFPDYLKAKLSFQTRMGLTEWSTAISVLVQIRCSFF